MTQTYRTNDPARWGTGQGFNLSPAQVDINFWDLVQRMLAQEARPDPSAGIDHFEINGIMLYVHMTDGTVQGPYELPVAIFRDRGPWAPSAPYSKMDTFSINGGLYVVLVDHTSDTTFDPGANDGAGNDYYQLMIQTPGSSLPSGGAPGMLLVKATEVDYAVMWGQANAGDVLFEPTTGSSLSSFNVADALEEIAEGDITYDAAIFVPGSIQRVDDELLFLGIANRSMHLASGNDHAYAYLDVGNDATGATDIVLSIEWNRIEIGTITFAANGDIDTDGGQNGAFNIPAIIDFAEGDTYALRVTQSDNAEPSGLSVTLPFVRTDI